MLELTGRKADGWLPDEDVARAVRRQPDAIRTAAKEAGRDPDAITPAMLGYVLLAPGRRETLHR